MKVLFINRVYPPAPGATGDLLAELAPELARLGWHVTILSSTTALPAGTLTKDKSVERVEVHRVGGLAFTRASHLRRALSYLSLYPALLWRALRLPRADVVVTMTDPPLQLVLGPLLRLFKRARLVHWAQDVYPELAEKLEVITPGGALARLLRGLSRKMLRWHDSVICVGQCMKKRLQEKGVDTGRLENIPNWADPRSLQPVAAEKNVFRREQQLQGRFVVMYSGNFGLAHNFQAVIEAASVLEKKMPAVLFLMVGEGPGLKSLKEEVARLSLGNVRFLPPQPREHLSESLSAADLHLASMRDELCGLVVPSKVYAVLAAGRPVVFLGPAESEAACLIEQLSCGTVVSSASGQTLAEVLQNWAADPGRTRQAGELARAYALQHGPREAANQFHAVFSGQKADPGVGQIGAQFRAVPAAATRL